MELGTKYILLRLGALYFCSIVVHFFRLCTNTVRYGDCRIFKRLGIFGIR